MRRVLAANGIAGERDVVLYGYEAAPAAALAAKLAMYSERDVRLLEGGWDAWSARIELPVERLPNFRQLVHVDWLRDLIAGRKVHAGPKGPWLLFHVNVDVSAEYAEGSPAGRLVPGHELAGVGA